MAPVKRIISLKEGASPEELEKAKQAVTSKGGKVTHEFKLIKAFSAEFPEGTIETMESNDHVTVEEDKEVRTQ